MASYRLLYQSKEIILRYKWASIYVPALLGGYFIFTFIHGSLKADSFNMADFRTLDFYGNM